MDPLSSENEGNKYSQLSLNVVLSTLKPRQWVKFSFQGNIIAKMTLMKVQDQRCFNSDLKMLFC